jgi:hypothetical protein
LTGTKVQILTQKALQSLMGVAYVRRPALILDSLIQIGVDTCSKVLVVCGQSGHYTEPVMADQRLLLLLSMIESQLHLWGHFPDCLCQLNVPNNIKQMNEAYSGDTRTSIKHSVKQAQSPTAAARARPSSQIEGAHAAVPDGSVEQIGTRRSEEGTPLRADNTAKETTFSSKGIRTHMRYAAGCIIHQAEFSSLFAAAYYTPGVLDLMKAMCGPPKNPQCGMLQTIAHLISSVLIRQCLLVYIFVRILLSY